jgi:hypothetical protein
MIGRRDIVLFSPVDFNVTDLVLRVCRDRWPKAVFQDADSHDVHAISEPWVWTVGTRSGEFFVYREQDVIAEWLSKGVHAEEPNSMLHFLVRNPPAGEPQLTEVTLVYDKVDRTVRSIIESLRSAFLCALSEQGKAA